MKKRYLALCVVCLTVFMYLMISCSLAARKPVSASPAKLTATETRSIN